MSSTEEEKYEKDKNEIEKSIQQLHTDDQETEEPKDPPQKTNPEQILFIKNLKFRGMKDRLYSNLFIQNFEHFAEQEKLDENEKRNHFIESLTKYAAIWMEERGYGTYDEMKEAFLAFYWSSDVQKSIQDYLNFGKYNKKFKLSMAKYFLNHAIGAKFLDSAPSEKEIISKLLKHFDANIEEEVLIQKAETIEETVEILMRIDALKGNVPSNKRNTNLIMSLMISENNKKNFFNSWGLLFLLLACTSIAISLMNQIYFKN